MGRLQRRLDKYQYDGNTSTFTFSMDSEHKWLGQRVPLQGSFTVKLFPEGSSTAVAFQQSYHPVADKFTGAALYDGAAVAKNMADIGAVLRK